ncbi:MAG: M3 family oligoendopeptidase [Planctomycetota bacterium]|jgi:M3 family oligoendopeptidase
MAHRESLAVSLFHRLWISAERSASRTRISHRVFVTAKKDDQIPGERPHGIGLNLISCSSRRDSSGAFVRRESVCLERNPMSQSAPVAPNFEDVAASIPDLESLSKTADSICDRMNSAAAAAECVELLREWDLKRCEVGTYDALVSLRFHQDTANATNKAAQDAWDAASPRWTELEVMVKRVLLAHPLRSEIEAVVGAQAFALWESDALAFDATIKENLARELALGSEFTELKAGAKLTFRGEALNLSTIRKYRQSADRELRHGSEQVFWSWYAEQAGTLDRIFDDLVKVRTDAAHKLGFENFIDLGYKRMCRVDYNQSDVEQFRAEIQKEVVPLCVELIKRQTKDLEVESLMAWDEYVLDLRGNPLPKGDRAWMVDRAVEMFDDMGNELGGFFRTMNGGGFMDLDSRDGKAGGGFCTSFPTHGMPYIFANFNGTKGDVEVLTHEIGHAFQNYCSKDLWPSDYHWPTYESAEVHSMGLEFLTWPHMDSFFKEDGERFRQTHLTESLLFLSYGTAVDHFQHLIYAKPMVSPAERHEMWLEMEQLYMPWRQWGDLAHAAGGGRWQDQSHIYQSPFYYIDYVLAQTCALQFWAQAEVDRPKTMKAYVALCQRGGSAPFQDLVRGAGLTSPFDSGCLRDVVQRARETLKI